MNNYELFLVQHKGCLQQQQTQVQEKKTDSLPDGMYDYATINRFLQNAIGLVDAK